MGGRALIASSLAAVSTLLALISPAHAQTQGEFGFGCQIDAGDSLFNGQTGVLVNGQCVAIDQAPDTSDSFIPVRTIDCGQDPASGTGKTWNDALCGPQVNACPPLRVNGRLTYVDTFLVQQRDATGNWVVLDFWCPGNPDPIPRTPALREAVLRLIPTVVIGTTPGIALVNAETIVWADTGADRDLGAVTVVGVKVWLRIHLHEAQWDFGDGTTETTTTPGTPYPDAGECSTAACDAYYGHVYRQTGPMTVRLTVSWTADYSLNGTDFAPIATDPLPGPASSLDVHLKEARGVLVPNPR